MEKVVYPRARGLWAVLGFAFEEECKEVEEDPKVSHKNERAFRLYKEKLRELCLFSLEKRRLKQGT